MGAQLHSGFEAENENNVSALDELSLWAAPSGLRLLDGCGLGAESVRSARFSV
jgi:hypothetical protein